MQRQAAGQPVGFIRQLLTYGNIIGRKTLLGATLGAVFAYTEASLEHSRGVNDSWNGIAGGAAAGLAFSLLPPKPWPQAPAFALWFASAIYACDVLNEKIPACLQGFRWVRVAVQAFACVLSCCVYIPHTPYAHSNVCILL